MKQNKFINNLGLNFSIIDIGYAKCTTEDISLRPRKLDFYSLHCVAGGRGRVDLVAFRNRIFNFFYFFHGQIVLLQMPYLIFRNTQQVAVSRQIFGFFSANELCAEKLIGRTACNFYFKQRLPKIPIQRRTKLFRQLSLRKKHKRDPHRARVLHQNF